MRVGWINLHAQCSLSTVAPPALVVGRDKSPPRRLHRECRNYKTWLATIFIFISKPSIRQSIPSLAFHHFRLPHRTHARTRTRTHTHTSEVSSGWLVDWLTRMWNIGPHTCFLFPPFDTTQLKRTFNFHVLKKGTMHHFVMADHHSFQLILLFKLVENHARKIKEYEIYGSKVRKYIRKNCKQEELQLLRNAIAYF
jgi:hypothetical protein